MVVAVELVTALTVAGVLSFLAARSLRRQGRRSGFFWFFLLVFMLTWAGGVWLMPFGPMLMGVHWLPFALVGLAGALIVSLLARRRYPADRRANLGFRGPMAANREREDLTYLSLNIVFWLALVLLAVAVIVGYVLR